MGDDRIRAINVKNDRQTVVQRVRLEGQQRRFGVGSLDGRLDLYLQHYLTYDLDDTQEVYSNADIPDEAYAG